VPSINLDFGYFGHPKTCKLIGLLGHDADVLPLRLWCYCGRYFAGSGKLSGLNAEAVERVMGWRGQRGKAVEALLEVGFLELDADGVYVVHDWLEHSGHLAVFEERAKKAAKARWDKARQKCASSNASSTPSSIPSSTTSTTPQPAEPTLFSPERGYSEAAMRLKFKFESIYRGPIGGRDGVAAFFEDLLKSGRTEQELMTELGREGRQRTEPIFKFAKRMGVENGTAGGNAGHSGRIHDPAISAKAAARSIKV
jgi:hypothetical protein